MKKTAVFAVLILCIAAVVTAGCIGQENPTGQIGSLTPVNPMNPTEPLDYPTAIIGDWKSVNPTSYGDREFYIIYHFNDDNTGTMEGEINGEVFSSVTIGWGHVKDNCYIAGYMSTSKADYLYISEDGKYLVNEANEIFERVV
ncbi:MAG: hypothetical protein IKK56_05680 [Methanocorpusculum sp.]|nr:hypothetical protein [Methanocorpusculum sp.]